MFYMYGRDIGSLKIKLLYANSTEQEVWNKSGNQQDGWKKMQISLHSVANYRIVVEAVRGVYWTSNIAIDDISVVAGLCNSDQKDQNPCVISCRSRNAQSFKMGIKVKDGTKCYSNRSSDMCIQGVCKKFGCDNKFGSTLTFDNCMVCGGDGSSCIRRTAKSELTPAKDYEIFLKLSKDSTFINITETSHKPHYIGLRKMFHNSIYLSTKYEDYFVIDGVSFHFQKVSNGFQHISCQGPLQKDIDVVAYTFTSERIRPLSLAYEYFGPISGKVTYQYKINRWQTCSRSCGTGKQQSVVACIRLQDSQEVNHKHCRHQKKPLYIRSCNLQECRRKFQWVIKQWSKCSKTCGSASRKARVVECLNVFDNLLADRSFCSQKAPITSMQCPTKERPRMYNWLAGVWKSCSKSCGVGTRTRTVTCIDGESKSIVNPLKCDTKGKPNVLEPCNIQECDIFIWCVHLEGKCSQTCGGGYKVRIVYCVNEKTKLSVENRYCDGPSPQRIVRCNERQCPEYAWDIVESSPCSVTCDKGTKERTIQCVDKATNQNAAADKCFGEKPPESVSCYERKCPGFNVAYTTWGSCSAACGRGIQKREAYCVSENYETILSPKECAKGDLLLKRSCQRTPCARSDKLFCNFDSQTYCDWENTKDDDFDWTIGKSTPSINTGPSKDHTTRSGYFAYIEASRPRKRGHKAELTSKYLKMKKGCLEFWYYMKGPSVGQLRVRAVSSLGERVAFEREAHQGGRWLQAKILANETEAASGYKYVHVKVLFKKISMSLRTHFPVNAYDLFHWFMNTLIQSLRK
ncbi:A disintegrin and metalloproteinase with thrombospondin motifs 18-like [Hydractinia symbiolongicarpus]|uniref:A disintegrin and metalloproteinase with thrombospondin motifs 18-like n=1 Tax=Hydractinia symbiolongicarpus TaxID=13093 RepID=UPI00254F8612|nr:A disintegrin and metalloproteinase with thrombospondin motifs 18-like [Hydractinia symbiolongicarpus]